MNKGNRLPNTVLYQLRTNRKAHCNKSDWTQGAVAKKIGVDIKSYRAWEQGKYLPDTVQLIRLAAVFGVSTDYLLGISPYTQVGNAEVMQITGLSEGSINTLRLLNSRGNRPGERGAYITGQQVEELSLLDDIITSDRFHNLFNNLSFYLVYGTSNPTPPYLDMSDKDYTKMQKWLSKRGLVLESKKNVCDMYLQTAADELKSIFREVLQKTITEGNENG